MATEAAVARETGGTRRRGRRAVRLATKDRIAVTLMVGVPVLVVAWLIWFPTISSILLSFTNWDGIGGLNTIHWIGGQNYQQIATIYPPFWPAVRHNLYWLAFLTLVATPFGLLLAYQLDKRIRGTRFYQSVFFLPVVLSLAIIGFIWQLIYSPDQGLINNLTHHTAESGHVIDWLGDPKINLWAVIVAVFWRHAGYIMVIYLAGLKAIDPTLREAAAIDGAGEWHAFRTVVFPALKPINIVVVITVIEALRAFDIVYIVNHGTNGLELLSVLVTNNIIGEASRIGYGSALGVILLVISIVPISLFVWNTFREKQA